MIHNIAIYKLIMVSAIILFYLVTASLVVAGGMNPDDTPLPNYKQDPGTQNVGDLFLSVGDTLDSNFQKGEEDEAKILLFNDKQTGIADIFNILNNWYSSYNNNGPDAAQVQLLVNTAFFIEQQWLTVELGGNKWSGTLANWVVVGQKNLITIITGTGQIIVVSIKNAGK